MQFDLIQKNLALLKKKHRKQQLFRMMYFQYTLANMRQSINLEEQLVTIELVTLPNLFYCKKLNTDSQKKDRFLEP